MQLFGILVATPNAAPSEGHAELSFGATPPPAAVDTCPEVPGGDAVVPALPIAPGVAFAVVVPAAVKGPDGAEATFAPPDDAPETKPAVAFAVPG